MHANLMPRTEGTSLGHVREVLCIHSEPGLARMASKHLQEGIVSWDVLANRFAGARTVVCNGKTTKELVFKSPARTPQREPDSTGMAPFGHRSAVFHANGKLRPCSADLSCPASDRPGGLTSGVSLILVLRWMRKRGSGG